MRLFNHTTFFRLVVGLAVWPGAFALCERSARADARDPDVLRLNAAGHSLRYNAVPAGKSSAFGHGEALVNAPLSRVVDVATDLAHYKDLVPNRFETARVVARNKDTGEADLYLRLPVLHGLVTLWEVIRFAPPRREGPDVLVYEGRFVKGNVKDGGIIVTMKSVDPEFTVLKVDLLVRPSLPVPDSVVNEELRDAAGVAVDALHDRAQGDRRTVALR